MRYLRPLQRRDSQAGKRYRIGSLMRPASLTWLGLIVAVLVATAASLAWAGGWFAPERLDQTRMIDAFEATNGIHVGFRRNHAKGVCFAGYFESNGAGAQYSKAGIFKPGRVPLFGRFALAGGMPMVADAPGIVRSMAVNFTLPDGEVWRTGMNDIPVFPVNNARGFYEQLLAMRPDPMTGKPDPKKMSAFLAHHPESVRAASIIRARSVSSGFANSTYNGLNAFQVTDATGRSTPVRWSMLPVDAFAPAPASTPEDKNYLFDDLLARLRGGPVQWHLMLIIAEPGDPTNDATIPWPASRHRIDAGMLTITGLQAESPGNCRDINFDPLVLPAGIAPSDDPLLSARSAAYSASFTRRAAEPKTPSAVQVESPRQ